VSCQDGWQAARTTGQDNYAADHQALLAVLAAIRGDHDECRLLLRELTIPPGAGALSRPTALSHWAFAVMDLASGRPADASARLAAVGDPATGRGQVVIQVLAAPWLMEAAARSGQDRQRALAVLDLFERWAHSTEAPLPRALAARCHALLAPRDSGAAVAHFREALRLHRTGDADFERARTELLFGQELRRQRRPREAREHLHRAVEVFRHLSLESWADRAASELRAAGERVEATRAAGDGLTAQQRQIARLVSLGATNREIAAQLFISPRTVDHHLRNIYHRLGVRSRVELARQLAE
jgi:DNA-binding CsgD family transcriptional regulator